MKFVSPVHGSSPPVTFSYLLFKTQIFLKDLGSLNIKPETVCALLLIAAALKSCMPVVCFTRFRSSLSQVWMHEIFSLAFISSSVFQLSQKSTEELPLLLLLFEVPVKNHCKFPLIGFIFRKFNSSVNYF
jgi:hypothetical protein